jgi:hypothetical protein
MSGLRMGRMLKLLPILAFVFLTSLLFPEIIKAQSCPPGHLPGDGNGDCTVDGIDYGIWFVNYGTSGKLVSEGNYNEDAAGVVDGLDYGVWFVNYGKSVNPPSLGIFNGVNEGETVSGDIFVTYEADTTVTQGVKFYIDGNFVREEVAYPYALGGDSGVGNVHPYDTTQLTNGTHTLAVTVTRTDLTTYQDQLSFTVNNSQSTQTPTNTKAPTLSPTKTPTPTSGVTGTPTPTQLPDGSIYWKGDAETGDLSQWCNITRAAPDRIQVITNPVHQGSYAYRFELRANDVTYSERVVLNQGLPEGPDCMYEVNGEEKYYGWSVYLPANFPKYSSWSLVAQWKGIHTGSPPIQLGLNNDEWRLYYRPNTSSGNILKWSTPVVKGKWERFVMHVKWSTDPSVGFIELWHDGVKVVPLFHTSNVHISGGEPVKNFVEIGHYRDSGIDYNVVLYIDGFTVGTTYNSVVQ